MRSELYQHSIEAWWMGFQPLISIVVQCQIEKECQLYYKIMVWRRLQIEGFKIFFDTSCFETSLNAACFVTSWGVTLSLSIFVTLAERISFVRSLSLRTFFSVMSWAVTSSASFSSLMTSDAVNVRGGFVGGRRNITESSSSANVFSLTLRPLATGTSLASFGAWVERRLALVSATTGVWCSTKPSPKYVIRAKRLKVCHAVLYLKLVPSYDVYVGGTYTVEISNEEQVYLGRYTQWCSIQGIQISINKAVNWSGLKLHFECSQDTANFIRWSSAGIFYYFTGLHTKVNYQPNHLCP